MLPVFAATTTPATTAVTVFLTIAIPGTSTMAGSPIRLPGYRLYRPEPITIALSNAASTLVLTDYPTTVITTPPVSTATMTPVSTTATDYAPTATSSLSMCTGPDAIVS